MYKRLIIVSLIILAALCGLSWMGYHSIRIRAKGMEGTRLGEFAEVAEQIRQDVKRKLDEFIRKEQNRPYTDYQYYYVPQNVVAAQQQQTQMPLLRSPLGASLENDLAYGNFQIEPDGRIVTPYCEPGQAVGDSPLSKQVQLYLGNIEKNLLPVLSGPSGAFKLPSSKLAVVSKESKALDFSQASKGKSEISSKGKISRAGQYPIESLESDSQSEQVLSQRRDVALSNVAQTSEPVQTQVDLSQRAEQQMASRASRTILAEERERSVSDSLEPAQQTQMEQSRYQEPVQAEEFRDQSKPVQAAAAPAISGPQYESQQQQPQQQQVDTDMQIDKEDMVQIRIEPFVPVVAGIPEGGQSIFGGQVFMLRHVQIENRHFLQGFQLSEKKLIDEIDDSAKRFMREGMGFDLAQTQNPQAAFAAILDFGFGDMVLNLIEVDPAWINRQISKLQNWYFSIIGIVFLAVSLGLISLWRNARAQIKLAQKKDDFISAVSHELRTPLTSIRMYSEMLEKKWVKSEEKVNEYYRNMRQESERLSRLIENVLDFSRIQKGRKKYTFSLGDINNCITGVVEMMRPYAAQNGFSIKTDFQSLAPTSFDSDAVAQIVVNLLDNAVKYARNADDKTITVRTMDGGQFILIEVQDHGPGVPYNQRKKVFEEFYRIGSEATRETTGTGLGLALVKKFAQAHNGFVEILSGKPAGAVFRVGLAV